MEMQMNETHDSEIMFNPFARASATASKAAASPVAWLICSVRWASEK